MQNHFICNISAIIQQQSYVATAVADTLEKAEEEARNKLKESLKANSSVEAQKNARTCSDKQTSGQACTNGKSEKQMRPVSEKQLKMIYDIARNLNIEAAQLTMDLHGKRPEILVNWEANLVIRDLQSKQNPSIF